MSYGRYAAKKRQEEGISPDRFQMPNTGMSLDDVVNNSAARRENRRSTGGGSQQRRGTGALANLGADYKGDENAATIVAASYNPNAAGANKYVRDLLSIESPTRDVDAPNDPNNTGAKGTIGGLSGGSCLVPQIQGVFGAIAQ